MRFMGTDRIADRHSFEYTHTLLRGLNLRIPTIIVFRVWRMYESRHYTTTYGSGEATHVPNLPNYSWWTRPALPIITDDPTVSLQVCSSARSSSSRGS